MQYIFRCTRRFFEKSIILLLLKVGDSFFMLINDEIQCDNLLLILEDGTKLEELSKNEALKLAEDAGLDLVQVSDTPVVCKLLDFNKYKYKQAKLNKSNKVKTSTKELRVTCSIGEHDLISKINNAKKLLIKGNNVRVVLNLRYGELRLKDKKEYVLKRFVDELSDIASIIKTEQKERQDIIVFSKK